MTPTEKTGREADEVIVPSEVFEMAAQSMGAFFEPICKVDRYTSAKDFLDLQQSFKKARILERYGTLRSCKLLEIGSGYGTNLAVWLKHFGADAYGAEPGGEGFDQGYVASQILLRANGLDPQRVVNTVGESLPFPDESFDIVYSSNVLEHTQVPEQVVAEAFRVLRPGGLFHMEMPNHLSYFEGHYMVMMPPLVWKPFLGWWVKTIFRRDPAFATTLHTRINPLWCRRVVRELRVKYPLELISLGEKEFLERLAQPFVFDNERVGARIGGVISTLRRLNVGNWAGRLMVALQGHFPIYMTVRKGPALGQTQ
jgi:SAM-dependent methyltransferase